MVEVLAGEDFLDVQGVGVEDWCLGWVVDVAEEHYLGEVGVFGENSVM